MLKGKQFLSVFVGIATCLSILGGMTGCENTSQKGTDSTSSSTSSLDPQKVTQKINLWTHYGSDDKPKIDYAVSKVKEKYPHLTFQIENMPQDGNQSIKARAASGSLPDIMYLSGGLISTFIKSNSIIQLDSYIKSSNFASELAPSASKGNMASSNGHEYVFTCGGAAGLTPALWYYNKKVFDENGVKVPTNYQELLTAVKAFKAKGVVPMKLWGKEPWPIGAFFDAFAMRENPKGILALSENKATSKTYHSSIEKISTLIKAGIFETGMTNTDYDTAFAAFTSGKAAMFMNGSWSIIDIGKRMGTNNSVDYFSSYPTGDGSSTKNSMYFVNTSGNGGNVTGYGVSANANNKAVCADVARIIAINEAKYEYIYEGMTDVSVDITKLKAKVPIAAMNKKLSQELPNMKSEDSILQNLSNTEFATGFFEEMQRLIVGEPSSTFEQNIDKLIQQSN